MKTENYSEYEILVSNEPSYYGSGCTQDQADEIAQNLRTLAENEFPGLRTGIYREGTNSQCITGPDDDTCMEIQDWMQAMLAVP